MRLFRIYVVFKNMELDEIFREKRREAITKPRGLRRQPRRSDSQ